MKNQKDIQDKQKQAYKGKNVKNKALKPAKRDIKNQNKDQKISAKKHTFSIKKRIKPIAIKKLG